MKLFLLILFSISLISCNRLKNQCSTELDNDIPISIDDELVLAKRIIINNMDSLKVWNVLNKKLIGQDAGILANLGLWNLIDGAYLESITIKNENLILFEYNTNSCTYSEEYVVFNKNEMEVYKIFKNNSIKIDSIQTYWSLIRVKQKSEQQ